MKDSCFQDYSTSTLPALLTWPLTHTNLTYVVVCKGKENCCFKSCPAFAQRPLAHCSHPEREVCTQAACHPLHMAHLFKERVRTATQCIHSPHASKWQPTTSVAAQRCTIQWTCRLLLFLSALIETCPLLFNASHTCTIEFYSGYFEGLLPPCFCVLSN